MAEIIEGQSVPTIRLNADNDEIVALDNFSGKQIVIYFYPKDDTPGCTKEAIAFSEKLQAFADANTLIFGISPDTITKHTKFKSKHGLTVTLLSDEEKEAAEAFGVWVEKNMYGKKYMGIERSTFLIDSHGKVTHIWRKVKVPGHVEAVLEAAQKLSS